MAFLEWSHSGTVKDLSPRQGTCELCGKYSLRYHFQIYNNQTKHELWVGSRCIDQFQVPVLDDHGQLLTGTDVRRRFSAGKRNARVENVLRAPEKLSKSEPKLENALHYYRQHGRLTPNQMSLMKWRLTDNQIDFELKDFKISLRRSVHKDPGIDRSYSLLYAPVREALLVAKKGPCYISDHGYQLCSGK